ncbi:hypothetical protein OIV83_002765 [Microbotryomycetes sp. JL201]|nr:hypothetical protein OIV83_002765 [Microbotryomycetes sp. JL201]
MHRVQPSQSSSTSTTSSASSRVSFDVRMSLEHRQRRSSLFSSGYTSPATDAGDDMDQARLTHCYDDGVSVLNDLYDDLALEARAPPLQQSATPRTPKQRIASKSQRASSSSTSSSIASSSSRWNSCASDFSRHSFASFSHTRHSSRVDSLARNLGRMLDQAWSPDLCFCGNSQEPESIYCSKTCAQADALAALEGGSTGPSRAQSPSSSSASSSDAASILSSASSNASTHYRRVVNDEERRMSQERDAAKAKSRRDNARKHTSSSLLPHQSLSPALQPHTHHQQTHSSSFAAKDDNDFELLVVPPPRTSSKRQQLQQSLEPMQLLHAKDSMISLNQFPTSLGGALDATPRPRHRDQQQTHGSGQVRDDDYDGVPSLAQLERQAYYDATRTNLGLTMLNQSEDEGYMDETSDSMSELCAPKARIGGHKKNKLSFDDVVGILSG